MARVVSLVISAALLVLPAAAAPTAACAAGDDSNTAAAPSDSARLSPPIPNAAASTRSQPGPQLARPEPHGGVPRWLDDVRAQRRAVQKMRRAQQDARKDEFLRRRHEILDMMENDRRLFRNHGPWLEPLPPAPLPPSLEPPEDGMSGFDDDTGGNTHHHYPPPGWDNGWYYNGW